MDSLKDFTAIKLPLTAAQARFVWILMQDMIDVTTDGKNRRRATQIRNKIEKLATIRGKANG